MSEASISKASPSQTVCGTYMGRELLLIIPKHDEKQVVYLWLRRTNQLYNQVTCFLLEEGCAKSTSEDADYVTAEEFEICSAWLNAPKSRDLIHAKLREAGFHNGISGSLWICVKDFTDQLEFLRKKRKLIDMINKYPEIVEGLLGFLQAAVDCGIVSATQVITERTGLERMEDWKTPISLHQWTSLRPRIHGLRGGSGRIWEITRRVEGESNLALFTVSGGPEQQLHWSDQQIRDEEGGVILELNTRNVKIVEV